MYSVFLDIVPLNISNKLTIWASFFTIFS